MLEDYDVTTCYDVINTAETLVLDRSEAVENPLVWAEQGITMVNITTYNMDCSDRFHVALYQEHRSHTECGTHIHCEVFMKINITEHYSQCVFECNCETSDCLNNDIIHLRVSNPFEGGLCDITMTPPEQNSFA